MGMGSFGAFMDAARGTGRSGLGRAERIRSRLSASVHEDAPAVLFEDFACYHWCESCRRLNEDAGHCSHCGSKHLLDLRDFRAARILQEAEAFERRNVSNGIRVVSRVLGFALYLALTGLWFLAWDIPGMKLVTALGFSGGWLSFFAILGKLFMVVFSPFFVLPGVAMYAGRAVRVPLSRLFSHLSEEAPLRWRTTSVEKEGFEEASTERESQSPLTGQRARGWKWQVLLRDSLATRPEVLLLEEKWLTPSIGVHENVTWQEPRTIQESDFAFSEEERKRFLRARGIFWDEGEFVWRESLAR